MASSITNHNVNSSEVNSCIAGIGNSAQDNTIEKTKITFGRTGRPFAIPTTDDDTANIRYVIIKLGTRIASNLAKEVLFGQIIWKSEKHGLAILAVPEGMTLYVFTDDEQATKVYECNMNRLNKIALYDRDRINVPFAFAYDEDTGNYSCGSGVHTLT